MRLLVPVLTMTTMEVPVLLVGAAIVLQATMLAVMVAGSRARTATSDEEFERTVNRKFDYARELNDAEQRLDDQAVLVEQYRVEAHTDSLTGLPNRRAIEDELTSRLDDWREKQIPVSLVVMDVDHFKSVNDGFGHPQGDALLRAIAATLDSTRRRTDFLGRYGGEEFALVLPQASLDAACRAAERERMSVLRCRFDVEEHPQAVTISAGVATAVAGDDAATLIKRADTALYAAKHAGRNRTFSHDGAGCRPVGAAPTPAAAAQQQFVDDIFLPALHDDAISPLPVLHQPAHVVSPSVPVATSLSRR